MFCYFCTFLAVTSSNMSHFYSAVSIARLFGPLTCGSAPSGSVFEKKCSFNSTLCSSLDRFNRAPMGFVILPLPKVSLVRLPCYCFPVSGPTSTGSHAPREAPSLQQCPLDPRVHRPSSKAFDTQAPLFTTCQGLCASCFGSGLVFLFCVCVSYRANTGHLR